MSTSSTILNNWDEGIHYCGDIDDLIDAIHEENLEYYALEDVLEKHMPDINWSLKEDIITDMIIALEELNADTFGD